MVGDSTSVSPVLGRLLLPLTPRQFRASGLAVSAFAILLPTASLALMLSAFRNFGDPFDLVFAPIVATIVAVAEIATFFGTGGLFVTLTTPLAPLSAEAPEASERQQLRFRIVFGASVAASLAVAAWLVVQLLGRAGL